MFYFIIQLFKEEYLDDIMLALTTAGIDNGTIVDGVNMDNVMNQHMPIFAGLIPGENQRSIYCKVITSVISDKERIDVLLQTLNDADIDFKKQEIGRMILVPAEEIIG